MLSVLAFTCDLSQDGCPSDRQLNVAGVLLAVAIIGGLAVAFWFGRRR